MCVQKHCYTPTQRMDIVLHPEQSLIQHLTSVRVKWRCNKPTIATEKMWFD